MVIQAYEHLKVTFERFKKPDGTKNSPGKTCRDIAVAYPASKSGQCYQHLSGYVLSTLLTTNFTPFLGEYWIDPNEGDTKDAILVHCDMEKRATCILPSPGRTPELRYVGDDPEVWLSSMTPTGVKVSNSIFFVSDHV